MCYVGIKHYSGIIDLSFIYVCYYFEVIFFNERWTHWNDKLLIQLLTFFFFYNIKLSELVYEQIKQSIISIF